ncbi:hypothetical protein ACHHYP_05850 [Achlya hypogyna]|uniref:Uncharacterized protein n=1 Tax=Achlya hypogyna TaxID=1202772 RepID=A0A1V9YWI3_ACHHY|nr:hypothetical protein ACHHYP_05850 [Achlya hypogyna]
MTHTKIFTVSLGSSPTRTRSSSGDLSSIANTDDSNLREAAASGQLSALVRLGGLLIQTAGAHVEGFAHTLAAARRGAWEAQILLAQLCALGHGCPRDKPLALRWLKRARLHNTAIPTTDIAMTKYSIAIGEQVVAMERREGWSARDASLATRIARFESRHDAARFHDIFAETQGLAAQGSATAMAFVTAYATLREASRCVEDGDDRACVALVRQAHSHWDPIDMPFEVQLELFQAATRRLREAPSDVDALFAHGVCSPTAVPATFWLHCTALHPAVAAFQHKLGIAYASLGQYEGALRAFSKAIGNSIDHLSNQALQWRYERAACLRRLATAGRASHAAAIDAYKGFLKVAPRDHPKTPEASYALALLFAAVCSPRSARATYRTGLEAEAYRLPCVVPLTSSSKAIVSKYLQHTGNDPVEEPANHASRGPPMALSLLHRMHRLPC